MVTAHSLGEREWLSVTEAGGRSDHDALPSFEAGHDFDVITDERAGFHESK